MTSFVPTPLRLLTLGLLGVLGLPLVVAVAALSGNGHRWVDILAQFTAPGLCVAVAVAVFAVLLRAPLATRAALVVVVATLVAGWPQWAPSTGRAQAGAPVVTLYSANVLWTNDDVEAIGASIAEAKPDIVALIEVSPRTLPGLEAALAPYPYRVFDTALGKREGPGSLVASRWPTEPLLRGKIWQLHAFARVETPLGPLRVVAVHLTRPWPYQVQWEQVRQVERIEYLLRRSSGPVVLAGDFNSVSGARIGRQIKSDLGVIPAPGFPGSWPDALPAVAAINIDQVYRSPDLALVSRRLGRDTGSDHRPVVTRLTLAQTPRPR